jgi:uncharacterized Zn-binding protein involved in type VI secretion
MPPAARKTDQHECLSPGHEANPIKTGADTILIGGMPSARIGDTEACGATIAAGEATVLFGGRPAARMGDSTDHGGIVMTGDPTVLIGSTKQADVMRTRKPFCQDCDRLKARRQPGAPKARARRP